MSTWKTFKTGKQSNFLGKASSESFVVRSCDFGTACHNFPICRLQLIPSSSAGNNQKIFVSDPTRDVPGTHQMKEAL